MLDTIFIARHGFRMQWRGNELGLSPTGRPRDPVLTAHGIDQVKLLADYFISLPPHKRPQMILSSPYYRCVQTAGPSAEKLDLKIHIEPGIIEWFPTASEGSGHHPQPMRASTVSRYSPRIASASQWSPLIIPFRQGESIRELHTRARRALELIVQRCEELGVQRVLLVSHAATVIAMGRALMQQDGQETTNWQTGKGIDIGAGTACLSLYVRGSEARQVYGVEPSAEDDQKGIWYQVLNGSAAHLDNGVEREWTFDDIPGNVEEPGMGVGWQDEEALEEAEMERLENAKVQAQQTSTPKANM